MSQNFLVHRSHFSMLSIVLVCTITCWYLLLLFTGSLSSCPGYYFLKMLIDGSYIKSVRQCCQDQFLSLQYERLDPLEIVTDTLNVGFLSRTSYYISQGV